MRIRAAHPEDVPRLREIEVDAGRVFRTVGMDLVAGDQAPPAERFFAYIAGGYAWCAIDEADTPIAFLVADAVDGDLHIEQVSVHPDHAHQGIGRALIERGADAGRAGGYPALTLTTFRDVAWNGPYYARLGFTPFDQPGPGLREIRAAEVAWGLDAWPRLCMRRPL